MKKEIKHPLLGLCTSQFLGAFNDNAWKLMVFTLATRFLVQGVGAAEFEYQSQMQATAAMMVFLVPMFLFSFPAGAVADRISKRSILIVMKALEVLLMVLATASLFFLPSYMLFPYILLGMMGMQSAIFSPAKYGILPQLLSYERLSRGNGVIEMWTMLAIIAGTGLGPLLLFADKGGARMQLSWIGPSFLLLFSFVGLAAAFAVPKVPAVQKRPAGVMKTLTQAYRAIAGDRILLLAVLGTFLYWLILSLLGQNVLVYAKALVQDLSKGELLLGLPPASYGIGIALGALLGGRLSGDRIEYGLIPFGAVNFALFSFLLGALQPMMPGTVAILLLMGTASGMLIIPLQAIVQWRAPKEERGAVIALSNAFNNSGMIGGSLAAAAMALIGLDLQRTLIASSLIVAAATLWSVRLLPEAFIRLFFLIFTTTFYRIRIKGKENIPKKGGALLISNHLSLTDAFFVMASVDRHVRFIINDTHYNKWWLKPFVAAMAAIPVPYNGSPEAFRKALRQAGRYLRRGEVLCIFPEGQVSRTGTMQPFRTEIEELVKDKECPIIPIYLDRVWGTIFSPQRGRFLPRRPQNIPHPLTVFFGRPLPSDASIPTIRQGIRELSYTAWMERKEDEPPLYYHFFRSVGRAPWKRALAEKGRPKSSRLKVMTSAICLAQELASTAKGEKQVGIILPPTSEGVIANLAVNISGRTVVNFNYRIGKAHLDFCIAEAEVETVITSRELLQRRGITLPPHLKVLDVGELLREATVLKKCRAAFLGLFTPMEYLEKKCGAERRVTNDDLIAIIFTSGSTATPKGVMLTHFNLSSNVEGVAQVVPASGRKDKMLHALPLFHSFGYVMMWLGLNHSLPLVMHPNPLDAEGIGEVVKKQKVTMLWTTPSFLRIYTDRLTPDMFGSLRFVLTGAEKLPQMLSDQFASHFGIRPVEGYGITECSPVVATNTLDVRRPGVYQVGTVPGTVGQPLPGVQVKVVDPVTFEELPLNTAGLLLVKGPNIMKGYLGEPELTEKVIRNGWYITGDIASIDENDFIVIVDRLTRFSKISGEMVPHSYVEELLQEMAMVNKRSFAVTTVADDATGERMAVLHTLNTSEFEGFMERLSNSPLPKQFIPRADHFLHVEELPLLASGKLDLKQVRKIARERLEESFTS